MKVAPVLSALRQFPRIKQTLIHTGQHYDTNMSDVFFQQLEIPAPDINMGVGSGSHARQTADIMTGFEPIVLERKPDLVLVYGDVNSTVAAALVCSKLGVKVGHVEAGLRSFDRGMPEEINRLVTDQLADLLRMSSPAMSCVETCHSAVSTQTAIQAKWLPEFLPTLLQQKLQPPCSCLEDNLRKLKFRSVPYQKQWL